MGLEVQRGSGSLAWLQKPSVGLAQSGIRHWIHHLVILGVGSGLALTVESYGFRKICNPSRDSPDEHFWGSGLVFTLKTYVFCII